MAGQSLWILLVTVIPQLPAAFCINNSSDTGSENETGRDKPEENILASPRSNYRMSIALQIGLISGTIIIFTIIVCCLLYRCVLRCQKQTNYSGLILSNNREQRGGVIPSQQTAATQHSSPLCEGQTGQHFLGQNQPAQLQHWQSMQQFPPPNQPLQQFLSNTQPVTQFSPHDKPPLQLSPTYQPPQQFSPNYQAQQRISPSYQAQHTPAQQQISPSYQAQHTPAQQQISPSYQAQHSSAQQHLSPSYQPTQQFSTNNQHQHSPVQHFQQQAVASQHECSLTVQQLPNFPEPPPAYDDFILTKH